MKINTGYIIAGLLIAFILFVEIAAHADVRDQATKLTLSEPLQIPGQVLPAGTYLLKLANTDTYPGLVQVFNSDGTVLFATLQTVPAERLQPTEGTVIMLAEASGEPNALVKWFYPGNSIGNEFLYSKEKMKELAQEKVQVITARPQTTGKSDTSAVGN
jgi:hypothetical protein